MAMPLTQSQPEASRAAGSTAPSDSAAARESRLRGQRHYQRTASPAEIEADLGALRALEARSGPYQRALLAIGVPLGALFLLATIAFVAMARKNAAPLFVTVILGVGVMSVIFLQSGRLPGLPRWKIEAASSLLRRLDVAPGGEVSMTLRLAADDGILVRDQKVASSFWAGTSTFSRAYEDAWLALEAPLASGAHLRMTRTGVKLELVSTQSGGNQTRVSTRTSRVLRDAIAVRYDPAQNPGLAAAGPQPAGALRLAQDARVTAFDNQPGALRVTVDTGPRADGTQVPAELAATIAAVVHLAAPSRYVVKVDGEAWAPDLAADAEARRQGLRGALRSAAGPTSGSPGGTATIAGGTVMIVLGLVVALGSVGQFRKSSEYDEMGDRFQSVIPKLKATLAKAKTKAEREEAQAQLQRATHDVDSWHADAAGKARAGVLQVVAGGALLAGGAVLLARTVRRRRREQAPSRA